MDIVDLEGGGDVLIRSPRVHEAEVLAALHVECWRQTYADLLPPDYFDTDRVAQRLPLWERLVRLGRADPRRLAVASMQDDLVGFALAGPPASSDEAPPRPLQLWSIYLRRDAQGSGAGQALLDAVVADEPAFLWVAEQNGRARAFYNRNGFRPDGARHVDELRIAEIRLVR